MTSRSHRLASLILLTLLAVFGAACASSGADAPEAVAAKPDLTQEMGENGLPTPRALMARHIEAAGGEEAIRAVEYRTVKGTMEMPAMGMQGDMTLVARAPDSMSMVMELGGLGSMVTGYDGEHGWSENPMTGSQLLEGDMLDSVQRQADFYSELNFEELYPVRETVEELEWEGRPVYKVRLEDADGEETIQYFDRETNFLVGSESTQTSEMGTMDVTTVMSDYQDAGGIKVPMKMIMRMQGMEIIQNVEEVSFEPVDDAAFAPPPAIQKLIDAEDGED